MLWKGSKLVVVKKSLLLLLFFSCLLVLPAKIKAQTEYTIIPDFVDGDEFPSNMEVTFSARVTTDVPIAITFNSSWGLPQTKPTSGGRVSFVVTTPISGNYWVEFSSSYTPTVHVNIKIVKAIVFDLKYNSTQHYAPSYDPSAGVDILIWARAKESDYWTFEDIDRLDLSSNRLISDWTWLSIAGWLKITITTFDEIANYNITLTPEKSGYLSISSSALITVGSPEMYAKIRIGDSVAWGGLNGSMSIQRGQKNIYISLYNTKSIFLPGAEITNVLVEGGGGGKIYEGVPYKNENGEYVVPITLTDALYILHIEAKYGAEYLNLNIDNFSLSTFTTGFNIWDWILSPFFALIIIVILVIIARKLVKHGGSGKTFGGKSVWD